MAIIWVIRDFCKSLFWSITVFIFFYSFACIWLSYTLKTDYVVHTKGVVLITGTSSGIGNHATFAVAENGYIVFATVRNEKSVKILKEEARTKGLENKIIPIILDVTNITQIEAGFKEISTYLSTTGLPMVAIVNNAGFSGAVPMELENSEHIQLMFDVNLFGSVSLTQKFLHLIRRDKGRLIFIGSLGGFVPSPGKGVYSGTKRAIEAVVDTLRLELEPFGVSVSSLVPGFVKTNIVESSLSHMKYKTDSPIPPDYESYYKKERAKLNKLMELAPTPEVTSNGILDALKNPFPDTRYFMGTYFTISSYTIYIARWFVSDYVADGEYIHEKKLKKFSKLKIEL